MFSLIAHNTFDVDYVIPNVIVAFLIGWLLASVERHLLKGQRGARPQTYKLIAYSIVPTVVLHVGLQLKAYLELGIFGADFMLTYLYILIFFGGFMLGLRPGVTDTYPK